MEKPEIETKEIIISKKEKKLSNFYAVSILKALYPEAKVIEIDPERNKKIIEEAKKDSSKILIGIGKELNPDMRNYDSDEKTCLELIIENELPNVEKVLENPNVAKIFEIINFIDKNGYEKAIREYGIETNSLTKSSYETILNFSYDKNIGEIIVKNPEKINRKEMLDSQKKLIKELEKEKDKIIEEIKENWKLTEKEIKEIEREIRKEIEDKMPKMLFATNYSNSGKMIGLLYLTIDKAEKREEFVKKYKENFKKINLSKFSLEKKERKKEEDSNKLKKKRKI